MQIRTVSFDGEAAEAIRSIRYTVFTREQGVDTRLDFDGHDPAAVHALAFDGETAVATGRLLADGHLGRFAVLAEYRGRGVGRDVVLALVTQARNKKLQRVFLGAQVQAVPFYLRLGFEVCGENYLDAGIEHTPMQAQL